MSGNYVGCLGHSYAPGDVKWDEKATLVYPFLCIAAGVIAGLLGVGGGVVKGPLMLEVGLYIACIALPIRASHGECILSLSFPCCYHRLVFPLRLQQPMRPV